MHIVRKHIELIRQTCVNTKDHLHVTAEMNEINAHLMLRTASTKWLVAGVAENVSVA